ncbi:hypothetical protein M0R04_04990 [Candidatus Dojkabacteria bacterium]|jgi:DNA replicative helicase MCM subunit Mcm2 (Cdc46/Mcm family)|nr:hypothetical protein [Candidatus Dojkabacteria bacterium]
MVKIATKRRKEVLARYEKKTYICDRCGKAHYNAKSKYCSEKCAYPPKVVVEKECPKCGAKHFKEGIHCSLKCANSHTHSDEGKKHQSKKIQEYHQTPEGQATRAKASNFVSAMNVGEEYQGVSIEEFAVSVPVFHELRDYDEFFEGFQKGENW